MYGIRANLEEKCENGKNSVRNEGWKFEIIIRN
jgi:hypothetical protein